MKKSCINCRHKLKAKEAQPCKTCQRDATVKNLFPRWEEAPKRKANQYEG